MADQATPAQWVKVRLLLYGFLLGTLAMMVVVWINGPNWLAPGFAIVAALMLFVCVRVETRLRDMRSGKRPWPEIDVQTDAMRRATSVQPLVLGGIGAAGFSITAFGAGNWIVGVGLVAFGLVLIGTGLTRLRDRY